jgi:hypothetical protein
LNEYYPYGEMGGTISLPPSFDKKLYFDGIYSHPLSKTKQQDKLFAFEAMHDLRPDTEWRFIKGSIKMALRKIRDKIKGENSYYKRALRSNELFFVVNFKNIGKLGTYNSN